MRVLISIAILALAAAAQDPAEPANPSIVLQMPNDNENAATIVWDGDTLTIPQHTDRLDGHQSHLGMLDTNVSVIHRTLYHLEAKLNETSRVLAEVQQDVSTNAEAIRVQNERLNDVADDISANGDLITANGENIKHRACKAGRYRNSQGNCASCLPGRYQNAAGGSSCKPCSRGQYQDLGGMSGCKNCGAGKYQNSPGQTTCKECGAGKYDRLPASSSVPRTACTGTCATCAGQWIQRRCTATANTVCRDKWTKVSNSKPCNSYYGTEFGSLNGAKNACVGDRWCHGVAFIQKGGDRWHWKHGSNHRRRQNTYRKCKSENLRYATKGLASAFYDYNARPCEITAKGVTHCPTWN